MFIRFFMCTSLPRWLIFDNGHNVPIVMPSHHNTPFSQITDRLSHWTAVEIMKILMIKFADNLEQPNEGSHWGFQTTDHHHKHHLTPMHALPSHRISLIPKVMIKIKKYHWSVMASQTDVIYSSTASTGCSPSPPAEIYRRLAGSGTTFLGTWNPSTVPVPAALTKSPSPLSPCTPAQSDSLQLGWRNFQFSVVIKLIWHRRTKLRCDCEPSPHQGEGGEKTTKRSGPIDESILNVYQRLKKKERKIQTLRCMESHFRYEACRSSVVAYTTNNKISTKAAVHWPNEKHGPMKRCELKMHSLPTSQATVINHGWGGGPWLRFDGRSKLSFWKFWRC